MKKTIVFGVMLVLLVQTASLYADIWGEFKEYASKKDWNRMERVLKNNKNKITNLDRAMCPFIVIDNLRGEDAIRGFELLKDYGINPDSTHLGISFQKSQPDNVIDYLLSKGIGGIYTLKQAIKGKRFKYVSRLLDTVNVSDLDERTTRSNYKGNDWDVEYSWTALIFAVQAENFDTVRQLVEKGANVNLRDENGATAASIAYDNGLINIYNYLKEHGAIDFEQKQATTQPSQSSSTTNVYVQPSTSAPESARASAPSNPTLQSGNYAWGNSGTNITMRFNSITSTVSANLNNLPVWSGTYRINGNQLVINVTLASGDYAKFRGQTYSYTITSDTSFSGSGETWVRTGL